MDFEGEFLIELKSRTGFFDFSKIQIQVVFLVDFVYHVFVEMNLVDKLFGQVLSVYIIIPSVEMSCWLIYIERITDTHKSFDVVITMFWGKISRSDTCTQGETYEVEIGVRVFCFYVINDLLEMGICFSEVKYIFSDLRNPYSFRIESDAPETLFS